mmetsp:Transcript_454/g.813  ORF Transcript_454/g.813 Transcript_454/m.813 type:complete len:329 (-) Transcript_454:80-1066(-)
MRYFDIICGSFSRPCFVLFSNYLRHFLAAALDLAKSFVIAGCLFISRGLRCARCKRTCVALATSLIVFASLAVSSQPSSTLLRHYKSTFVSLHLCQRFAKATIAPTGSPLIISRIGVRAIPFHSFISGFDFSYTSSTKLLHSTNTSKSSNSIPFNSHSSFALNLSNFFWRSIITSNDGPRPRRCCMSSESGTKLTSCIINFDSLSGTHNESKTVFDCITKSHKRISSDGMSAGLDIFQMFGLVPIQPKLFMQFVQFIPFTNQKFLLFGHQAVPEYLETFHDEKGGSQCMKPPLLVRDSRCKVFEIFCSLMHPPVHNFGSNHGGILTIQ